MFDLFPITPTYRKSKFPMHWIVFQDSTRVNNQFTLKLPIENVFYRCKCILNCDRFFNALKFSNDVTNVYTFLIRECRGHDRTVVGYTITYAISAYHHKRWEFESGSDKVYSIQHYVIKFVCDRSVVFSGYSGLLHQ